jgi:hypothetical protein
MTTSSEHADLSDQAESSDTSLLPAEAKAAVEEIKAENAALAEAYREAEAQAEVVAEQARRMAEVTEEVLEELQDRK